MTTYGFTKEMLNILSGLVGKRFVSIEAATDNFMQAYGNCRINIDGFSIDITNETGNTTFFGEEEDVSGFSCNITKAKFDPDTDTETTLVSIDSIIRKVELITDEIEINDGEYSYSFDMALIVHTSDMSIMFSRDVWFSEIITISKNVDYDEVFPVSKVIESLDNDGEYKVCVNRVKEAI